MVKYRVRYLVLDTCSVVVDASDGAEAAYRVLNGDFEEDTTFSFEGAEVNGILEVTEVGKEEAKDTEASG